MTDEHREQHEILWVGGPEDGTVTDWLPKYGPYYLLVSPPGDFGLTHLTVKVAYERRRFRDGVDRMFYAGT